MYKSKAPLRLGLAGGGTDVNTYSNTFGGAVLNATINLYAYASINERTDGKIVLKAKDRNEDFECEAITELEIDGVLDLQKGVYNRIIKDYVKEPLSMELVTRSDAPAGSGLGSSSTLVVAMIGVFVEYLKLPLDKNEIAQLAYKIEREDLGMAGGKQDQYAATFGGINFMEFNQDGVVVVNPLLIDEERLDELQNKLILYNTNTSRVSAEIIKDQSENIKQNKSSSREAMGKIKEQAFSLRDVLQQGSLNDFAKVLDAGWQYKKQLAKAISNSELDAIYDAAINAGATGGKISGAGGGGFFFFYCPGNAKENVIKALENFEGHQRNYRFTNDGLTTWTE